MLDALGLDALSEQVYRGILTHPNDSVTELAHNLGISEEDVYQGLHQLSELSLVREATDLPAGVHAVSPQLGMEILLSRQQAHLASQQQRVEAGRAAAAKLIAEYAHQGPWAAEPAVHLIGVDTVRDYLATLNDQVEEEFLAFAPGKAQTAANMRASRPLNKRLLNRGVRMRTIYLDSIRRDEASRKHAEWISAHGGQVRTTPYLPNRMIICDQKVAIIAVDNCDTSAGAMVFTSPGLISVLYALFEKEWRSALPLGSKPKPSTSRLSRLQTETLHLLAQGHTDESVAKRLGVSLRTARRIASGLMSELHGRSRFQAGVRAVQEGHLPSTPD